MKKYLLSFVDCSNCLGTGCLNKRGLQLGDSCPFCGEDLDAVIYKKYCTW